jgi:ABC-type phosphate transport system substrate-binding protein
MTPFRTNVVLLKVVAFCLALILSSATTVHAGHDPLKGLAGPPFTDPSEIMAMPDAWKKQPIKYDVSSDNVDLVVSLDQQMQYAYRPLIHKFAEENNLNIIIHGGTCGISSGLLSRKAIDIGGFCCAPGLMDRLPGLQFHTLGISALALIIHPDNPVDNITLEQAQAIFMGKIHRWSELKTAKGTKGPNLPIEPVARLHCKNRPGRFSPNLREVGAIPDMISQVSANKHAIGHEILWMTRHFRDKGRVKSLKINGHSPDNPVHLLSGDYPLYRVFSLTTWEGAHDTNQTASKLVKYLMQQVEHLDEKFSFVPASRLRQSGWKFKGNELIGEPEN